MNRKASTNADRKIRRPLKAALATAYLNRLRNSRKARRLQEILWEQGEDRPFYTALLDELDITLSKETSKKGSIPKTGGTVVVSNHPFGAIEGLVLLEQLKSVRPDVKILANSFLGTFEKLRKDLILVDPFVTSNSGAANAEPLREALRFVRTGGMLIVFPAGEVSHLTLPGMVTDPEWHPAAAWIARRASVPVIPIFFHGRNSGLFQAAGLVHSGLRTAMLGRELLNKKGTTIRMHIGEPVPPRLLTKLAGAKEASRVLRYRTYLLSGKENIAKGRTQRSDSAALEPVIGAVNPDLLAAEIRALPVDQTLAKHRKLSVHLAMSQQIPHTLDEIGRLREITFRKEKEGTGKSIDLDRFDSDYRHLFLWNDETKELVGAYRLGLMDTTDHAPSLNLYSRTLFKMNPAFFKRLGSGIELGRSFIREEYQREPTPLFLLWKGIGSFVCANPRYRYLFGPVSISGRYTAASQRLISAFLRSNVKRRSFAKLVKPLRPLSKTSGTNNLMERIGALADSVDELSSLVSQLEQDGSGVPVLVRQYLNLGGDILALSVDPDFSNALDGLVLVDLAETSQAVLNRYMGKAEAKRFLQFHNPSLALAHPTPPQTPEQRGSLVHIPAGT